MSDADEIPDNIGIASTRDSDKQIVAEFDDVFDCGPGGSNSRSEAIKRVMHVMAGVKPAYESADLEFVDARDERGWIRQAVYDRIREEDR